eukprot:TRINITY_DN299_c1_g1_i1.p1 TRINITY_DN299_c1_g1~~TRINITY_DN299_c1_g1_i1.p1  ORF type:complete len:466 (-),score=142.61 TRINITY_DN299_c1_g1_i1:212-1609(-)
MKFVIALLAVVQLALSLELPKTSSPAEVAAFQRWLFDDSPFGRVLSHPDDKPTAGVLHELATNTPHESRAAAGQLTPIVIVSCYTGVRIEAKLTDKPSKYWWCDKNTKDWITIFAGDYIEYPMLIDCWLENMQVDYEGNGTYSNYPGVETRSPFYGSVEAIEYLDPKNKTNLWHDVIEALVTKMGYKRDVNIRAHSYDWRLAPNDPLVQQQFQQLKGLIETTYSTNNNTPVALFSFSLGGNYVMLFLNTFVDQAWKDTYLQVYTSLSGAFGGSSHAPLDLAAPFAKEAPYVPSLLFRETLRHIPANVWLFPYTQVYGADRVIASTPIRNYSANYDDLHQLLLDSGADMDAMILADTRQYLNFTDPGVPVNCIYGFGTPTVNWAEFPSGDFDDSPIYHLADGDYTVMTFSLGACEQWNRTNVYRIANMTHEGTVHDKTCIETILMTLGYNDPDRAAPIIDTHYNYR